MGQQQAAFYSWRFNRWALANFLCGIGKSDGVACHSTVLDGVLDGTDGGRIDRWTFYHPGVQRTVVLYGEHEHFDDERMGRWVYIGSSRIRAPVRVSRLLSVVLGGVLNGTKDGMEDFCFWSAYLGIARQTQRVGTSPHVRE